MSLSPISVSVVIISHNEGDNLHRTIDSLLAGLPEDSELIIVDDSSTDGSTAGLDERYAYTRVVQPTERLGVARARNFGGQQARGEIIVFCDAHVVTSPGWVEPLQAALSQPDTGAVGPVVTDMHNAHRKGYGIRWTDAALNTEWLGLQGRKPYPVPILSGCFTAMRRDVFLAVGGFDSGLVVWGHEDGELSLRLWTSGYTCLLVPAVEVAHLFRRVHPYQVDREVWLYNTLRVATVHFGPDRLRRVTEAVAVHNAFQAASARLTESDTSERRQQVRAARCYDDDWFFSRFGMDNV